MRLLVLLSCAFLLGWMLSWMYYAAATDPAELQSDSAADLALPPDTAAASISAQSDLAAVRQADLANQAVTPASLLELTRGRLQRGEFDAVMAEYPVLQGQLSADAAAQHRKLIVDHARSLQQMDRPVLARSLLGLYLQYEYRDVSALLLMAAIDRDADRTMEAIETLFQAKSYAYTPALIEQTEAAIRSTVQQYSAELQTQKDDIAQLALYQRLVELEPQYTQHYIALAEAYLALGNAVDARKTLELTQHDLAVQPQADAISRRIEAQSKPDQEYAAEVSLQPFGNQFLVDVVLNNSQPAVLLLDTGASLSIISSELMRALGIAGQPSGRMAWFSTAGGRVQAPILQLELLALDGVAVENVEVGVIAVFDDNRFDGLLGMNFLRYFEFFIDQNQNKLKLNPHGG